LEGDNDTYQIWRSIGIPTNQIVYGPPKDNFWSMGDAEGTPCGPCTEVYYDTRVGDEHDEDR
jgi:alanyl-tRNA synthetase